MSTEAHNRAISDLLPDTIIELYEVELGGKDGIKRFHAGKLIEKDIVLSEVIEEQGGQTTKVPHTYYSIPFEVDGFESRGDGQLPRPKLTVANPKGVITDLIKRRDDLVGSLFKRVRIFLKYIDEENFPDGINPFATSDPSSRFDDDIYVFNRKVTENKYLIEFELVSPLEMENAKLPARIMIANYCPWHYRGLGCLYGQRGLMEGPVALSKAGSKYFLDKGAAAGKQESENLEGNLGIAVADENNKGFVDAGGYDTGRLNWAYDYDHTGFTTVTTGALANDEAPSITLSAGTTAEIPRGRTIKFSDGSLVALSATAVKGATSLASATVNYGGAIGEIKYGGLKTPTTGGTLASGVVGTVGYVVGDMIRVKPDMPTAFTKPESSTVNPAVSLDRFFVCIKDHYTAQDPRYKSEYWREDQCGKSLFSCRLRYEEFAGGKDGRGLPFGGFPSIEAYRYTN